MRSERINPKSINPESTPEHGGKAQYGIYFGGAGANLRLLRGIGARMNGIFGENNSTVVNSALFAEAPAPDKIARTGELVKEVVKDGAELTIVAHSLGGSEAIETLDSIEKNDANFLTEHGKDIHVVLVSSTAVIRNLRGGLRFMGKYMSLLKNEIAAGPFRGNIYRRIVSLTSIPPSQEILTTDTLQNGLRRAFPKISLHDKIATKLDYNPDRDYLQFMDPAKRKVVDTLDAKLAVLMQEPEKNRRKIKRTLKKRAKVTNKTIEKAYAGEYADHFGDKKLEEPDTKWTVPAFLGLLSLLNKTFINPEICKKLVAMKKKGVNVKVVFPEYEFVTGIEDVAKVLGYDGADRNVAVIPGTHTAPLAVQPNMLETIVDWGRGPRKKVFSSVDRLQDTNPSASLNQQLQTAA